MVTDTQVRAPKDNFSIRYFLQEMVKGGALNVYGVVINKRELVKDDDDEQIIRIKKGASLIHVKEIKEGGFYILEDPSTGNQYHFQMSSYGGVLSEDGDQTIYSNCLLEKLVGFDPKKVTQKSGLMGGGLNIPEEMVETRIKTKYDTHWRALSDVDIVDGHDGGIKVEGEKDSDPFLEKFYAFLQN